MIIFFIHSQINDKCIAKFGDTVPGTIQMPNSKEADASSPRFTFIDIVMYSVSAVAGFLIVLFIIVLLCTACCCCCCCTKAKGNKRSDIDKLMTV